MNITAELRNWRRHNLPGGSIYWGNIYSDTKNRWVDGTLIHTSMVVDETPDVNDDGAIIVKTLNSVYIIRLDEEWKYDPSRKLQQPRHP